MRFSPQFGQPCILLNPFWTHPNWYDSWRWICEFHSVMAIANFFHFQLTISTIFSHQFGSNQLKTASLDLGRSSQMLLESDLSNQTYYPTPCVSIPIFLITKTILNVLIYNYNYYFSSYHLFNIWRCNFQAEFETLQNFVQSVHFHFHPPLTITPSQMHNCIHPPDPLPLRVPHRYTAGRVFPHCTHTHVHHNLWQVRPIPYRNSHGV